MRQITNFQRNYFYSGWAFLTPYLAAYLLYAWLKWPINAPSSGSMEQETWSWVPCLLHVYWFLHVAHVLLGCLAFISWWRIVRASAAIAPRAWESLSKVFPWLCLALLFWIPGAYLEWPADPWEHLRRINEWRTHDVVMQHSTWEKSSYFIPYSILGQCIGLHQLFWLDFYHAGIGLLLSWQYYRLARTCGLGARISMIFVFSQALFFGNNIFSFHRYYGLSSSIYAQLGAVALTRVVIVFTDQFGTNRSRWLPTASYVGLLLALTLFNHKQGILIAALGIGGVTFRTLFDRKLWIGWLLVLVLGLLIFLPKSCYPYGASLNPASLIHLWVSSWYGFKIFVPNSLPQGSMLQVVGLIGIVNALAAIWLIRHNHIVGWLTLFPVIALCLPYVAIPVATTLAEQSVLVTFQRLYFAIPVGLALVCAAARIFQSLNEIDSSRKVAWHYFGLLVILLFMVVAPPGYPSYNRSWNALSVAPNDARMDALVAVVEDLPKSRQIRVVSTDDVISVLQAFLPEVATSRYRLFTQPVATSLQRVMGIPFSTRRVNNDDSPSLLDDAKPLNTVSWLTVTGTKPHFLSGSDDFPGANVALQSVPGESSEVFLRKLLPVDPEKRYVLEATLKEERGANGHALLAVAWHDNAGRFLNSSQPMPNGATNPAGWRNGTYSYFGPIDTNTPKHWTTYRIIFGLNEATAIPSNARSLRIGALLNFPPQPDTIIGLSHVRLSEISKSDQIYDGEFTGFEDWLVVAPKARQIYTAASQAAHLSVHWLPQKVALGYAGELEIATGAVKNHAVVSEKQQTFFYFFPGESISAPDKTPTVTETPVPSSRGD